VCAAVVKYCFSKLNRLPGGTTGMIFVNLQDDQNLKKKNKVLVGESNSTNAACVEVISFIFIFYL